MFDYVSLDSVELINTSNFNYNVIMNTQLKAKVYVGSN